MSFFTPITKRSVSIRALLIAVYLFLAAGALTMIVPLVVTLSGSMSGVYDAAELMSTSESRRVGMVFSYIGGSVAFDPNLWGFGAVPVGPTGLRGAEINANMMGIFSGVKDPRVREPAWRFIEFFGSEEAQRIRITTLVELGMINQINPADLRRLGHAEEADLVDRALEEEFRLAQANGKPEPYGRNCDLVYLEMTYPLDQILLSPVIAAAWKSGDRDTMRREIQRILAFAVSATSQTTQKNCRCKSLWYSNLCCFGAV